MLLRIFAGHERRRHVELFCGALGVSLALRPKSAVINDISTYLINLYQQIKLGTAPPASADPMTETEFFARRDALEQLHRSGVRSGPRYAELFLTVMRGLYRGIYKERKDGTLGVSTWNTKEYPNSDTPAWEEYEAAFKNWSFQCGLWEAVPRMPGDLVIADPPYHETWAGYKNGGFPYENQLELALALAKHDGPFCLHNDHGMAEVYRNLRFDTVLLDRTYAGSKGPKKAKEVVSVRGLPTPEQKDVMSTPKAKAFLRKRRGLALGVAAVRTAKTTATTTAPRKAANSKAQKPSTRTR